MEETQLISLSVNRKYLDRIDTFKDLGIFSSRKETMDIIIGLGLAELERKQPTLLSAASALKVVKDSIAPSN